MSAMMGSTILFELEQVVRIVYILNRTENVDGMLQQNWKAGVSLPAIFVDIKYDTYLYYGYDGQYIN